MVSFLYEDERKMRFSNLNWCTFNETAGVGFSVAWGLCIYFFNLELLIIRKSYVYDVDRKTENVHIPKYLYLS